MDEVSVEKRTSMYLSRFHTSVIVKLISPNTHPIDTDHFFFLLIILF